MIWQYMAKLIVRMAQKSKTYSTNLHVEYYFFVIPQFIEDQF